MFNNNIIQPAKPFLRWAGGKRWLLKSFGQLLPFSFGNYHEPFLGGGSVFLYLKNNNKIKGYSFLSDFNTELINAYKQLQEAPEKIIVFFKKFKNEKEFYYTIRVRKTDNKIEQAAIFIYLNKTSYNGIYRVNRNGQYNVPFGYRTSHDLFSFDNLFSLHKIFCQNVNFCSNDFDVVRNNLQPNDFVFLDPPYTVAHENNGFIQYNQQIFSWNDQERLADLLQFIISKKAYFILTNAAHVSIKELFEQYGKMTTIERHSTIGGRGASRKNINEYIFTNIKSNNEK